MTDIYDPRPPWRQQFDAARDPYAARNTLGIIGTGGSGAPTNAEYITATTDATLTNERVLTNTATITWDFSTPGQAKASSSGGGNVSNSGTPAAGQYAKWVTATTIQGVATATVLTDIGAQPLDADLTAIAALTGTNTIYYRSAANTWSAVNVSTGLAFSGGNLTATATGYITTVAVQKFTASGTYTPASGMKFCLIECVGGGGGGGGSSGLVGVAVAASGGGSGGYSRSLATAAAIGASKAVVIGAAGIGGVAANGNGSAGGDTSVGTLCIGKGGGGGTAHATSTMGGAGGIIGTGDIIAAGAPGGSGFINGVNGGISTPGGMGGSSIFGGGAVGSYNSVGLAAGNYGSGGSGASIVNLAASAAGGNGSAGIVIITEYI